MNGVLKQSTLRLRAVTVHEPDYAVKLAMSRREWGARVREHVEGIADLHGARIVVAGTGIYRYRLLYGRT